MTEFDLTILGEYPWSWYPVGTSIALLAVTAISWSWGLFLTTGIIRRPIVEILFWVGTISLFGGIGVIAVPIFTKFVNG